MCVSGAYFNREIAMLVLSRKLGEKIVVGENIVITVVKIDRNQIRIGIEAPQNVPVYREEIAPQRIEKKPRPEPVLVTH
jgi:carbon storage regulator